MKNTVITQEEKETALRQAYIEAAAEGQTTEVLLLDDMARQMGIDIGCARKPAWEAALNNQFRETARTIGILATDTRKMLHSTPPHYQSAAPSQETPPPKPAKAVHPFLTLVAN